MNHFTVCFLHVERLFSLHTVLQNLSLLYYLHFYETFSIRPKELTRRNRCNE